MDLPALKTSTAGLDMEKKRQWRSNDCVVPGRQQKSTSPPDTSRSTLSTPPRDRTIVAFRQTTRFVLRYATPRCSVGGGAGACLVLSAGLHQRKLSGGIWSVSVVCKWVSPMPPKSPPPSTYREECSCGRLYLVPKSHMCLLEVGFFPAATPRATITTRDLNQLRVFGVVCASTPGKSDSRTSHLPPLKKSYGGGDNTP
ncbi:unnamed protein product [Schistocephalus solidus]|uniref:Uncharacterized protein n=1 Tax=Schistocephalus solidus TaxID=70667 RepID=A0A183T840_SCHSO|nr:unnamed protein product [Schistocephalus solidus]